MLVCILKQVVLMFRPSCHPAPEATLQCSKSRGHTAPEAQGAPIKDCALEGSRVWHGNLSCLPTDTLLQEVLAVFRMPCGPVTAQTGILRKEGGLSQCRLKRLSGLIV